MSGTSGDLQETKSLLVREASSHGHVVQPSHDLPGVSIIFCKLCGKRIEVSNRPGEGVRIDRRLDAQCPGL